MKEKDTCFVTKVVDRGNKGRKEVIYTVAVEGSIGSLAELQFWQLEQLAEFLIRYVKEEKEGGDA